MNAVTRFLRTVAPSAALSLAIGLGSWQVASAQAPPAGPALGPDAGPAIAGPIGDEAAGPIGPALGPDVAGPDAGVDAPPPGPALLNHFVHVERFPRYREIVEYRTELLLFEDNSFNLIYPSMGEDCHGDDEAAGPTTIVGTWGIQDDQLSLQFEDGFVDYAQLAGPSLDFDGSRWDDLLAAPPADGPVGPDGPAVDGPVGPGIGPQ